MRIYPATDWSILQTGKQCNIFDRCVLQQATDEEMESLNGRYAFVFPLVLLMECAKSGDRTVYKNIEKMDHFLLLSTHKTQTRPEHLISSAPVDIMKKDLGVSLFTTPEEDTNLVHLIPYDKEERMDLLQWAADQPSEEYYNFFDGIEQNFQGDGARRVDDIVENISLDGWRHGKGYVPKNKIETHVVKWIKDYKKAHGFNPFYGNSLKDVLGLVKMTLAKTTMLKVIDDLSKAYQFDPSWPRRQIESRPHYPKPDDYAKYTFYYYFMSLCLTYCGNLLPKPYLRDWEYTYYLPFCPLITADKRFFKNLKSAMKSIRTDQIVGIAISDRILIWREDQI